MDLVTRNIHVVTLVLLAIALTAVLYLLSGILIPFVLAAFLTVLFKPAITWLHKKGAPTIVGLLVVLIISMGAIWGLSTIVALGVESAVDKAPEYTLKLKGLRTEFQRVAGRTMAQFLGKPTVVKLDQILSPENAVSFVTNFVGTAITIASDGALVLLYMVFMTLGGKYFPDKMHAALTAAKAPELGKVYASVNDKVLKYLRVKTLFNLINGAVTFTVLTLFGVDFAPALGLLAFLFSYIPNIGSLITTVIPGVIALVQFESLPHALLIVGTLIVLQNIVGNFLEPRAMGSSLDISPTVVLFSLVFWGWMWGIVGMILSVPIMAILKTVMEQFPVTQPLAILMSNRAPQVTEPTAR